MFKNARLLRLIPDKPSKGGSKTAQSTFTPNTDIRVAHNIWVYQGRWQRTPGLSSIASAPAGQSIVESFSIHNYLKYSLTNASLGATSLILTHDKSSTGTNYLNALFPGTGTRANPPVRSVLATPDECTPAVYANIKNRCFISWSGTNSFIFDGTATTYNGEYSYDIGVEGPVTAPTYTLGGSLNYTNPALYFITATTGSNKVNGLPIFPTIAPIWVTGIVAVTILGIRYDIQSPGGYVASFTTGGTATGIMGTPTLTINAFLFPPNGDWNGLNLTVGGHVYIIESYVPSGADTTVTLTANLATSPAGAAYTVTGEQLVLTTAYQGTTNVGGILMFTYEGALKWPGTGPQYSYAYYDPVTGHVSNESPQLQVAEDDQAGVTVLLDNIMPSASTDQERFTKIIIFRTQLALGASGVRYPLGTFGYPSTYDTINNTGALPLTYTDNHPDTDLLSNGGLIAPSQNNAKPPPATHQMYFDQRVWLNPVNDPTAIIFSANFYEVPFGVAEECFPVANQLRIPSDDGRVRGMRLVGSIGEITTDRYSYAIVGDGLNSASYRLVRLGPQTFGVGDYQMEELPGDIGDNSAVLAYLSRDTRVFLLAPSYGNVPINDPVVDIFAGDITTPDFYYDSRIHYYPATSVRLLILSLPSINMVFNFDQKVWCSAEAMFQSLGPFRPGGFTTIYGGDNPIDLYMVATSVDGTTQGQAGQIYSWMNATAANGPANAYLETAPIDLSDGQKRRSRLSFVRVYTDAPTCDVTVTVDEATTPIVIQAVVEQDPAYSLYASSSTPIDAPNAKELVAFLLKPLSDGTTIATDGFRHQVRVTLPANFSRYSIYAIDIGYQFLDDEGTLEP